VYRVLRGLPLGARMHPAPADDQHHQDDRGDATTIRMTTSNPMRVLGAGDPVIPVIDAVEQA
jgi:hypothetical protein